MATSWASLIGTENSFSADNIGSFYKFVNNRLTCSSGIATLIDNAGNAVTTDTDKAELLNQYFGYVCTKANSTR